MNEAVLYSYSAEEARQQGELALWRASHQANIACKTAIEQAICGSFDGPSNVNFKGSPPRFHVEIVAYG